MQIYLFLKFEILIKSWYIVKILHYFVKIGWFKTATFNLKGKLATIRVFVNLAVVVVLLSYTLIIMKLL